MEPVLGLAIFWLAFAGTHIGLSMRRVRGALVARLGEWGFIGVFSLVASVTFAALVRYFAVHRFEGFAGPALGASNDAIHVVLLLVALLGLVLALASLASYPASPYALGNTRMHEPRGLERVTRHPFFAGLALFATAHALLATRLVGCVFFAVLAGYALLGSWHQDRRFLASRGEPYARYLAATSFLPFVAVLSGRQRIALREQPWLSIAGSALVVVALRAKHDSLLAADGAWLIAAVVGGAAVAALGSWRRSVRHRHGNRDATAGRPAVDVQRAG